MPRSRRHHRRGEEDKPLAQPASGADCDKPHIPCNIKPHAFSQEDFDANADKYGLYLDMAVANEAIKQRLGHAELFPGADRVFMPTSVWLTGACQYWLQGQTGVGTVVGVIDSGIDDSHPALQGKVLFRRDYVAARNKGGNTTEPISKFDPHGTHVAGTIAAVPSAGYPLAGVAPGAQLIDYRVLGADGFGSFQDIVDAVYDAVDDGCHILNMSLGSRSPWGELERALLYARENNVAIIAAAGNDQRVTTALDAAAMQEISYPAYYRSTLAVAACELNKYTGEVSPASVGDAGLFFSNTHDRIDVAADGQDVLSCVPGGKYDVYDGTSMATPCVAGMAALLRSRLARRSGEAAAAATDLHVLLKSEAVDTALIVESGSGRNQLFGFGVCTLMSELPRLDANNEWRMPTLGLFAPDELNAPA